jgi:hypothetical protein
MTHDITLRKLRVSAVRTRDKFLRERGERSATVKEAQRAIDALDYALEAIVGFAQRAEEPR